MVPSSPATLLVFTRGPRRERLRRRLLPARAEGLERRLYRRCLEEAVAAGRAAGCRVAVSSPERLEIDGPFERFAQRGHDFGARLRDAIARARRGGGPLVVVGTDAPGLTPDQVGESLELLRDEPERVVVGPSPDGGFYLLAAARPLDRELADVAWCRRRTLATLLAALRRAGRPVTLLAPLADLDRPADLERLLARRGLAAPLWGDLAARLLELLAELTRPPVLGPPLPALPTSARPASPRAPPR